MQKRLLILSLILTGLTATSQDLRISYNTTACNPSPWVNPTAIYMYAGIGTVTPSQYWDYVSGGPADNNMPLYDVGSGVWEICVDPYTFQNTSGANPPVSATVKNMTMYFHNASSTIYTGNCANNFTLINTPYSNPTYSDPLIISSLVNCFVKIEKVPAEDAVIYINPNPVKTITDFHYSIRQKGNVTVNIFNILGKKVSSYHFENISPGPHKFIFDAGNANGSALASGCYFYSFNLNGTELKTGKLIISK